MSAMRKEPLAAAREVLRDGADCLSRAAGGLGDDFLATAAALAEPGSRTVVIGVGKSGHIGTKFVASLVSTGHRATFMHPQEALHGDLGQAHDATLAVLLSHSGSTDELRILAPTLRDFGAKIVTITAFRDCLLAGASDWVIETLVEAEAGLHQLAPTSSSTTTLSICDALMIASLNIRGFSPEEFRLFHPSGLLGRKLMKVSEVMTPAGRLPWLKPTDSIWTVIEAITAGARGFALVSDDEPGHGVAIDRVGAISEGDIRRALADREGFADQTAGQMMTAHPKAIAADALMLDALRLMEANRFTFLLCSDDAGGFAGAVHMHEILARDLDVAVRSDRLPDGTA
ncbi:MAG: KpsF/GutQ family sugar-phosphate isomerase [Rhodospirillales bacterium]|nr:KpsF/GutQ family sugar-phosphate isomerase [Rhodospirillales bacterium]